VGHRIIDKGYVTVAGLTFNLVVIMLFTPGMIVIDHFFVGTNSRVNLLEV